jgi:hypothetical protein
MNQSTVGRVGTASASYDTRDISLRRSLYAGILAGQAAGLIMAVVVMAVFTLFLGKGPLFPVQVIGSFVFGDAALQGFNAPAFLTGLALHQLGPSLGWGVAMGLGAWAFGLRGRGLALMAVGIGLVSQAIDVNLIGSRAFTALHGHDIWAEQVPAFWSWAAHLVFGLGLLLYPSIEKKLR